MEKNPFKWPIAVIGGILVWITEIWFNLPAALLWPTGDFSPFTHFHSYLGSPELNSVLGAQFYNCGQVFQGLAVILFAGGLYVLYGEELRKNILVVFGQLTGGLLGFGLVMNGVFHAELQPWHGVFSQVVFYCIFFLVLLVSIPLLWKSKTYKIVGVFGLIASGLNIFFVVGFDIFYPAYILEWLAIYVAESWLALVVIGIFHQEVWTKSTKEISKTS